MLHFSHPHSNRSVGRPLSRITAGVTNMVLYREVVEDCGENISLTPKSIRAAPSGNPSSAETTHSDAVFINLSVTLCTTISISYARQQSAAAVAHQYSLLITRDGNDRRQKNKRKCFCWRPAAKRP